MCTAPAFEGCVVPKPQPAIEISLYGATGVSVTFPLSRPSTV
jgi:hypothetical protein